jgi:hypothetical protein
MIANTENLSMSQEGQISEKKFKIPNEKRTVG